MSTVNRIATQVPALSDQVRVKFAGNIVEVRHMLRKPRVHIRRLNHDFYLLVKTGEVREYKHATSRADNVPNVKRSLATLRDLLNTNVSDTGHAKWITLTFAESVTNPTDLYSAFRRFIQRLRYYFHKNSLPDFEYIVAAEPSHSHGFHLHLVLIFSVIAPFLPNETLAKIWGHGFTKVKKLDNITNLGLYLTAILTDISADELSLKVPESKIKTVTLINESEQFVPTAIIKGARLSLYPTGMRIFRKSKGIADPTVCACSYGEALQEIGNASLHFERSIEVLDDDGHIINQITYQQFDRTQKDGGN